jgi:hypothetical protein
MGNNLAARLLMVFGFIALSLGYSSWVASRTVLDTKATTAVAHPILGTPSVQHALREKLADALDAALADAHADPHVKRAVAEAARDPRITAAFTAAIGSLHQALLSNGGGDITLDPSAITDSMRDALADRDPELAAQLANAEPLRVQFQSDKLPHLGSLRDKARTARTLGLAAGILLIAGSFMLVRDRKAIGRAGRRVAYLAICPLVIFALAPRLLDGSRSSGAQVGAAALRSYSGRVLPSAIALAIIGASIALIAMSARVFMRPHAVTFEVDPLTTPDSRPLTATPNSTPGSGGNTLLPEKVYL